MKTNLNNPCHSSTYFLTYIIKSHICHLKNSVTEKMTTVNKADENSPYSIFDFWFLSLDEIAFLSHSRSFLFIRFHQNVSTPSREDRCQHYIQSRDTENDWVIYFKASKCEVTFIPHILRMVLFIHILEPLYNTVLRFLVSNRISL